MRLEQALTRRNAFKMGKRRGTVIAAVVHELVKVETFETYADLTDGIKRRLARLRIPYDGPSVNAAIVSVEHTRRVLEPAE